MTFNCWKFKGGKSKGWSVCAIALLSFTAGSLITAHLAHIDHVRADSNRVFELRIYRTVPGKLPALESRFRDIYSKLLAKHDLQVVGYWVPEGAADWDNTFVYLVGSFQPGGS
jgi:NIPSNAP protein